MRGNSRPAIIFDQCCDIIAVNAPWLLLHQITHDEMTRLSQSGDANWLHLLFADEFPLQRLLGVQWERVALSSLRWFRIFSPTVRDSERYHIVRNSFQKQPVFRLLYQQVVGEPPEEEEESNTFIYHHPTSGLLGYVAKRTVMPYPGSWSMTELQPEDAATRTAFNMLHSDTKAIGWITNGIG